MPFGRDLPIHFGSNEPDRPGNGSLDSIWSLSPPISGVATETIRDKRNSLKSIFDKSPSSTTANGPSSPEVAAKPHGYSEALRPPEAATESQRFLVVQSGELTVALEAVFVREVTRFSGLDHFDSGPLATTVRFGERKLIFSALDSLMGFQTKHPDRNTPITIVGYLHREAALMVDRISGIVDAAENKISGRDLIHPHQKGWLAIKDGGRAAIVDLDQILDRVLFETNRGNR